MSNISLNDFNISAWADRARQTPSSGVSSNGPFGISNVRGLHRSAFPPNDMVEEMEVETPEDSGVFDFEPVVEAAYSGLGAYNESFAATAEDLAPISLPVADSFPVESSGQVTNLRDRNWVGTFQGPSLVFEDAEVGRLALIDQIKRLNCVYFCVGPIELAPTTGHPHCHFVLRFPSPRWWHALHTKLTNVWLKPQKGSTEDAVKYCLKEATVVRPGLEHGTRPQVQRNVAGMLEAWAFVHEFLLSEIEEESLDDVMHAMRDILVGTLEFDGSDSAI